MYYFSAAVTWTVVHLARLHRTYLFVFSFAYNMFVLQTCWVSQCPSCTPAHFKLNHILRCKFVFSPLRLFRTRDPWFSLLEGGHAPFSGTHVAACCLTSRDLLFTQLCSFEIKTKLFACIFFLQMYHLAVIFIQKKKKSHLNT